MARTNTNSGGGGGGVTQIIAGTGISVNNGGVGVVTVTNTGGSGGTPSAPDTSVQYNNAGAFAGDAGFTRDANDSYKTNIASNDGAGSFGFLNLQPATLIGGTSSDGGMHVSQLNFDSGGAGSAFTLSGGDSGATFDGINMSVSDDGATRYINFGDTKGNYNQNILEINDHDSIVDVRGNNFAQYTLSTPVFTGSGLDDLSVVQTGTFNQTIPWDVVVTVSHLSVQSMTIDTQTSTLNPGDTITGDQSSSTGTVLSFVLGTPNILTLENVTGDFTADTSITDTTSGNLSNISAVQPLGDMFDWAINGGGDGTGTFVGNAGAITGNIQANVASNFGHTIGNSWDFHVDQTFNYGHSLYLNNANNSQYIGDYDGFGNGTLTEWLDQNGIINNNVKNNFRVKDTSGDRFADFNLTNSTVAIGDLDFINIGASLEIDYANGTINADTQAASSMSLNANVGLSEFGDLNHRGNSTYLTVYDNQSTINFYGHNHQFGKIDTNNQAITWGDVDNTLGGTNMLVDVANQEIIATTALNFEVADTNASKWLQIKPTDKTVALGDLDVSGNGTRMKIDDTAQTTLFLSGTSFVVKRDNGSSRVLDLNPAGNYYNIGDIDGFGNRTKIGVDDGSKIITIDSTGTTVIGDTEGAANLTKLTVDDTNSKIFAAAGSVRLNLNTSANFAEIVGARIQLIDNVSATAFVIDGSAEQAIFQGNNGMAGQKPGSMDHFMDFNPTTGIYRTGNTLIGNGTYSIVDDSTQNLLLGGTIVEQMVDSTTYGGTLNYSAGFAKKQQAYFHGSHSGTASGVLLPTGTNATIGSRFTISDLGSLATTDPITVDAGTGNTITSTGGISQTFVINANGESVSIIKLTNTDWMVI